MSVKNKIEQNKMKKIKDRDCCAPTPEVCLPLGQSDA